MKKVVSFILYTLLVFALLICEVVFSEKEYASKVVNDIRIAKTSSFSFSGKKENIDENTQEEVSEEDVFKEYEKKDSISDSKTNMEEKKSESVVNSSDNKVSETKQIITGEINSVYVGLTFKGNMTAYGKDCCSSDISKQGITATGFDLKKSLYYEDNSYGKLRVVATDRTVPLYSVIKINDSIDGVYNAIVLDRGGSVLGINKNLKFDLAVESEEFAAKYYGVHRDVVFEVLRVGK